MNTANISTQSTAVQESAWRSAWTKATFLVFCWASLIIFGCLGFLLYYLVHPRFESLNPVMDIVFAGGIILCFSTIAIGLSLITLTALTGIDLLYPHNKKSITIRLLFPIAVSIGKLFRIDRTRLRVSFVKVNNAMTKAQRKRIKGDRILVLLPHCLQIDVCNRKITNDINNCRRCGRCPVGDLITLGEKYGLKLEVVNGGTLARKKVASFKPNGIIAVACERDLTLGIQDVHPIPVYGVINDRPNGPCVNTRVDMSLVEEAISFFQNNC